jgi:hypothetical protein
MQTVPAEATYLKITRAVTPKFEGKMKRPDWEFTEAVASPKTGQKTTKRPSQRAGVAASRTPLSAATRDVAVTFSSRTYQKLKLAADMNGVTIPVLVRQCVQYLLDPSDA